MTIMRQVSDHSVYVTEGVRLDDEAHQAAAPGVLARCCGYLPQNSVWDYFRVFSPFWRIYYNFSPGHHITCEGRVFPLTPDHFLLIPEETLFHCASAGGFSDHLYIHFDLSPGCHSPHRSPIVIKADEVAVSMARSLSLAIPGRLRRKTLQLSLALLHWVLAKLPDEVDIFCQPPESLQKTLHFIQGHLGQNLSNTLLARVGGVSVRSLVRLFENEIHLSPQAYVRGMRLREAARRLVRERETIEHITEDLGFANRAYFTRQFTKHFGYSPGAFRRKILSEQGHK